MELKQNKFLVFIARYGYVTKGMVYFTIGLLAVRLTIGAGGSTSGSKQVLELFSEQPFGFYLLIVCMAGLLAHAVWRISQGLVDPEDRGSEAWVKFYRIVDVSIGLMYIGLSYAALQILMGKGTTSSDQNTEIWIAKILDLPFGKWMVLFLALLCVIGGLYQFYSAFIANFDYSFDKDRMSDGEKVFLRQLGRIGIAAWGIVYCMVGYLLYQAAVNYDPQEAGGLEDALNALAEQPYGIWVLGITSTGLLVYGIYLLVLSWYHKIYG